MKLLSAVVGVFFALLSSQSFAAPELEVTNGTQTMVLDRTELEALPQTVIRTISPYFEGEVEFSGPTLEQVIQRFGPSEETAITMVALNDYQVSGGLEELLSMDAVIATRRNGDTMSVRQRGPFWVILPLSDRPDLNQEDYHRFMVWQLDRIELHP